ncbi:MAG: hypothetical protein HY917_03250 [Candidatus Diapherotrites archaeon]|nr:hypothetical protein [Candidatus Diapherotrites archaeon]
MPPRINWAEIQNRLKTAREATARNAKAAAARTKVVWQKTKKAYNTAAASRVAQGIKKNFPTAIRISGKAIAGTAKVAGQTAVVGYHTARIASWPLRKGGKLALKGAYQATLGTKTGRKLTGAMLGTALLAGGIQKGTETIAPAYYEKGRAAIIQKAPKAEIPIKVTEWIGNKEQQAFRAGRRVTRTG